MSSSVVQTAGMIRPTTDRQDCDCTGIYYSQYNSVTRYK